jgi:2-dehydro-3-deoxyphosphogluconate aldolase / (4S)-4-hydroxy-2-oxoglutarate aldolase
VSTGVSQEAATAKIGRLGILPVLDVPSVELAARVAEALMAAGIDAVEITLRTDAALEGIEAVRLAYPELLVGAGTVRTVEAADRALEAGAQFVVSPGSPLDVIERCASEGMTVLPGACTPSEIEAATRAGARFLKFFPAEPMGGCAYLRALAAPFPDVSFVPTGGISAANLVEYLRLPNVVACGGSWMVNNGLVAESRFERIRELAAEALALVAEARGG